MEAGEEQIRFHALPGDEGREGKPVETGLEAVPRSTELSPRPVPTGNLRNDNGHTSKGRDFKIDATGEIGRLAARGRPVAGAIRLQPSSVPGGFKTQS